MQTGFAEFEPGQGDTAVEGRLDGARFRPVCHQYCLLENVEDADGGDDRRFRIVIDMLQDQMVCGNGQRGGKQGSDHQGRQKGDGRVSRNNRGYKPRGNGAQHEEFAMRDIDDPHDAEHQREAERSQCEHGGADSAL